MHLLISLVGLIINLLYISIIAHWLISAGAIKTDINFIAKFKSAMDKILNPVYTQIRKVVQPVNGFDFTPLVAIVGLMIIAKIIWIIL